MIDEFLELISQGQPYFVAINTIYKVIDNSAVVKALEKVAHAQVRAAFEALKEEKYLSRQESLSITLSNLYSAHKCCYIARVENTNPLNSGKLCEADYYICCLIAFIYYKKKCDLKLIEKYLYHAFCARENSVIYDNNLGLKDRIASEVVSELLPGAGVTTDLVKSTSRKSFFQYCQAIIGKVNCLETEESDKIYQIKDNSWHSLLNKSNRGAALGTSSIRIRCHKITIKVDQCIFYRGEMGAFVYYRLYIPIIIEERYLSIIIPKSWWDFFWGIFEKNNQKNGDLKYFLRRGNRSILDLINQNNSVKNKLALCTDKLDRIQIEEDGLYFWIHQESLFSSISDILSDDLFYAFEQLTELLSTLSAKARLRGR